MASNILHFYLNEHLGSTVMISLSIDDNESFQYNHWNWLHEIIGHIIHTGSIEVRDDGSLLHSSKYHPKLCVMNFYFGGATP